MSALICSRCNQEIVPGAMVEFIGPDALGEDEQRRVGWDFEDTRILTSDDAMVVHAKCPPEPVEIVCEICGVNPCTPAEEICDECARAIAREAKGRP